MVGVKVKWSDLLALNFNYPVDSDNVIGLSCLPAKVEHQTYV